MIDIIIIIICIGNHRWIGRIQQKLASGPFAKPCFGEQPEGGLGRRRDGSQFQELLEARTMGLRDLLQAGLLLRLLHHVLQQLLVLAVHQRPQPLGGHGRLLAELARHAGVDQHVGIAGADGAGRDSDLGGRLGRNVATAAAVGTGGGRVGHDGDLADVALGGFGDGAVVEFPPLAGAKVLDECVIMTRRGRLADVDEDGLQFKLQR